MPKAIRIGVALCLVTMVGCSSTARLDEPSDPDALAIEEVNAPEALQSFDPASTTRGTNITSGATQRVEGSASTAAAEAFVSGLSSSPPPASEDTQHIAEYGPGVSNGVIRIGATWRPKFSPLNAALYPETIRPDFQRVWRVITNAINSTGGIMGRRLQVVSLPNEPTDDEVCTFFTEEEAVIAVATDVMDAAPCLDDAGITTLAHAYALQPEDYREAPHALAPMGPTLQRANQLYIDGLYQQGFFRGDHKIGLIRWDTPDYTQLSNGIIKPALARYGLEIEEEVAISDPDVNNWDEIAQSQAEGKSAVQTFKRAGVDRLLTLDVASFILPEFTDYAEAQDYHPRYGLNSLIGGEWDMERKQLKGAIGIGWMPWLDLEPEHAYQHGSDGARRCRDLMEAAGEEAQMDTYNEAIWTSSICDAALLLKAAVEAGGPSITADSIVTGAESLGTSFQASNTLMTRFGPGRHEGAAAIRFLRWYVGCQCFRYTSDLLDAG